MPFTVAHIAYAWPLGHWGLSRLALAVGSMVPDIAHLLPRRPWTDHTALSVITFSIPLGVAIFYLIERWVAPGLGPLWPQPWREAINRLTSPARRPSMIGVILGIALGATTHIALDHCTHSYGLMVRTLPEFFAIRLVRTPWNSTIYIYQLLQQLTGLLGCLALVTWLRSWGLIHQKQPWTWSHLKGFGLLTLTASTCALYSGYQQSWWLPFPDRITVFVVQTAVAHMLTTALILVAVSTLCHVRTWIRPGEASSEHQSSSD